MTKATKTRTRQHFEKKWAEYVAVRGPSSRLRTVPLALWEAQVFMSEIVKHRHHDPSYAHKYSIGVELDGKLVGVAMVGQAKARQLDPTHRRVAEVTRLCTDGTTNACSILYAAAARSAAAQGYERIVTYILESEPGTSLKAAGWEKTHVTKDEQWDRPSRKREGDKQGPKQRWEKELK